MLHWNQIKQSKEAEISHDMTMDDINDTSQAIRRLESQIMSLIQDLTLQQHQDIYDYVLNYYGKNRK